MLNCIFLTAQRMDVFNFKLWKKSRQYAMVEIFLPRILNVEIHFIKLNVESAAGLLIPSRKLRNAFLQSNHDYALYGKSGMQYWRFFPTIAGECVASIN